jgi:2-polyprenyl-6-methoxyphenol hydroxylase-like FAD-dependent oxidoreductase
MESAQVTIIGAGPAGLTLALALSRLNVRVSLSRFLLAFKRER